MTDMMRVPDFPENRDYWEAAERGELLVKRCSDCDKPHYYPRAHCPFCSSAATVWERSAGNGAIYSYSVVRYLSPAYCPAYVELDGGPTMLTQIVDCDVDTLDVGTRVRVVFRPGADGRTLPMFTPSD